ncbi:hypothetical protein FJZ33_12090, partial [Candidatus Poribacteria bacterium]|nr:hypothetical protein [Candidatus Poribacteria bacterium]
MIIPRAIKEKIIQNFFLILSITAIITLAGIAFFLFKEAIPTFTQKYPYSIEYLVPVVHRSNQVW